MKAAIFDMDGLLIDSEPLWREAETTVFRSLGVPLTTALCRDTVGMRLDDVVRHWYARYPWQGVSQDAVEAQVLALVSRLILERGMLMRGAADAIDTLAGAGFVLAVASSSPMPLIRTVLEKFGMVGRFAVLQSADGETEGKPHPAVYLSTMSRLGASPQECIAFEDSIPGVRAARNAGAFVIAVPDPADASCPEFSEADLVLGSLADFSLAGLRHSSAW